MSNITPAMCYTNIKLMILPILSACWLFTVGLPRNYQNWNGVIEIFHANTSMFIRV